MPNPLELIIPQESELERLRGISAGNVIGDALRQMVFQTGESLTRRVDLESMPEMGMKDITPEMMQKTLDIALSPEHGGFGGPMMAIFGGKLAKVKPPMNPSKLAEQYGLKAKITKGMTGGEYTGGTIFVGDSQKPGKAFAGNWIEDVDFKSMNEYPENIRSASHEIAHGLFSKNPEKGHAALKELKEVGVPKAVAFESLVDMGGLYILEPTAITNPKIKKVLDKWIGGKNQGFRWFQNPYDKKWRFEIDDSKMKWNTDVWDKATLGGGKDVKLGDLIDHKELFDAYPELKNINIRHTPGKGGGEYLQEQNRIRIGAEMDPKQTLIHEIQHAVQEIEGFARGGNPQWSYDDIDDALHFIKTAHRQGKQGDAWISKARTQETKDLIARFKDSPRDLEKLKTPEGGYQLYHGLAGEIEAREAAKRMGLSKIQRMLQKPFQKSIPPSEAIVRFGERHTMQQQILDKVIREKNIARQKKGLPLLERVLLRSNQSKPHYGFTVR